MAALALVDEPDATVSDAELVSDGPSYTISTLERLIAQGLRPSQIFFITGADAFAEIETWHRYPGVLDLAHFVVISRPGVPASSMPARLPQLAARFRREDAVAGVNGPTAVFLVEAATPDVSSTDIRRRLRARREHRRPGSSSGRNPHPQTPPVPGKPARMKIRKEID